jgi:hypothetical protein
LGSKKTLKRRIARSKKESLEAREEEKRARQVGTNTEERFFSAFRTPNAGLPEWFYGIRKSSNSDDAKGIDAYAIVAIGEMPIQIKSTIGGMLDFNKRRPGNKITVVVVRKWFSAEEIIAITIERLKRQRSIQRMLEEGMPT